MAQHPRSSKELEGKLGERVDQGGERARRLEGSVDTRRQGFDARDRIKSSAKADFEDFRQFFGRDMETLRESQVSRGRLGSGGGFRDEDRLFSDSADRLNRRIAQRGVDAAGLDLRNLEGLSGDQRFASNLDAELLSGTADRATARENFERDRRKKKFGFIGGALGAGAGFLLGGPGGAATGAKLGGTVADLFS